ncbi:MAG: TrmO family methyltransferase [Desulfobacterales bacterium]|nr:TrmO family methyltransferase [Desulfobacterales bacterium]
MRAPLRPGNPGRVFACRSEYRPNPIALTSCGVVLVDRREGRIVLDYIDAADGTPLLDVKPYIPVCDRARRLGGAGPGSGTGPSGSRTPGLFSPGRTRRKPGKLPAPPGSGHFASAPGGAVVYTGSGKGPCAWKEITLETDESRGPAVRRALLIVDMQRVYMEKQLHRERGHASPRSEAPSRRSGNPGILSSTSRHCGALLTAPGDAGLGGSGPAWIGAPGDLSVEEAARRRLRRNRPLHPYLRERDVGEVTGLRPS